MREKNTKSESDRVRQRHIMRQNESEKERERDRVYHIIQPDSRRIGSIIEYSLRIELCIVI